MGTLLGVKAFVASVLGGIGSIGGAIAGGLVIGVLETVVVGFFGSQYRDTIVFGLLVAALLLYPRGVRFRRPSLKTVT